MTPLRASPAFARLWLGNLIAGVGSQMTIVAVGLHVYELSRSTFAVSMVGVIALVPMIIAGIYGGMLADAFDRRTVALVAAVVAWLSTIGITITAWSGVDELWPYYALTCCIAVAATIIGTARLAILPRLLPTRLLPAAAALNGASFGISFAVGPALAGVFVAAFGYNWTYTIDVVLFSAAFVGIATLPRIVPEGDRVRPGLGSVHTAIDFLSRAPNIRMTFIVDVIAMTFGRPHALFPAAAALLIGGGPITVGVLTAAGAVGAFLSSVFSGTVGTVRRQGVAIGWAIVVYGAFTLAFGILLVVAFAGGFGAVSPDFADVSVPALVIGSIVLAGAGAADNISSIFRMAMIQSAVPDRVLGRLQGVFTVVVTGGPRLGDLYVGLVVLALGLWVPPLLGGIVIIALVAVLVRMSSRFRSYDALDPQP